MGSANGQPPRQVSTYAYEVVRFDRTSHSLNSCITIHHIGSYDTFARAQAKAHEYLQLALSDYYRNGQPVGYFNEINLERSGSIVVYQERPSNGYMETRELVVSEFRMLLVNTLDKAWQAESRLFGEKFTLVNPRVSYISNGQSSTALPPASRKPDQNKEPVTPSDVARQEEHVTLPEPTPPPSQFPPMGPQYDQEKQPDWTQTRIPLFDRRDDGPFRRPCDRPYAHTMVLLSPPPTLPAKSGPQNSGAIWSKAAIAVV
ncbi:hypothetical protein BKA58DRAFT_183884 [Alternaria rosae]|uniref:uncharacterized protein n=1 Tax=Alternaria rosae TaxID=1187941 RepID=UPI001E8E4DFB|nr:uncharacterized protein BKA58DRAFT_183884 [Alternaria rosae]KAH6870774.1 hypothetical protein BKA58DRAFT_183884 [Alternaria rosae]